MRNKYFISFTQILFALFILILGSQISFEIISLIPFTAQSLVVISLAIILGGKKSFIVVLIYLILGALNFPVFADGASGFKHFLEPSGGYLIGFLIAVMIVGILKQKEWDKTYPFSFLAFIIGHFIILLFGFLGLIILKDAHIAWQYGVKPFILAAILKSLIGGLIMPTYYLIKHNR